MLADQLADYLYARSTGHFASLMTLITRGCHRAIKTGAEPLTAELMDHVRNDEAAEQARQELAAAFERGLLTPAERPRRGGGRKRRDAPPSCGHGSRSALNRSPASRLTAGLTPTGNAC